MTEADAIRRWTTEYLTKHPHAFVHKIADATKCAQGHLVATGKKPCDLICFDEETLGGYYEFKMATSGNPAAAINNLLVHQLETLVRIGRLGGQAACVVFLPRDKFNGEGPYVPFHYFHAGVSCQTCMLRAAPKEKVCQMCIYAKDGKPDV